MDVIQHYNRENLYEVILEALAKANILTPTVEDLWPVDQFHIGGATSTLKLLEPASISASDSILDVGCGLGGPARLIAHNFDCETHGVDLTPVYIETATKLSKLVGLDHRTYFKCADALALPYPDDKFNLVWTQHVQMNIQDKAAFYNELLRVLKPGGTLVYHDIFKGENEEMIYPTPWSDDGLHSFLFSHAALQTMLSTAHMDRLYHQEETSFAIGFFQELLRKIADQGAAPLGLHLVMGATAPQKIGNLLTNIENGSITVHQGIHEKIKQPFSV